MHDAVESHQTPACGLTALRRHCHTDVSGVGHRVRVVKHAFAPSAQSLRAEASEA
jgi:hypothetical protein